MRNQILFLLALWVLVLSACGQDAPVNTPEPAAPTPGETLQATATNPIPPLETAVPPVAAETSEHPGPHALGDMVFHQGLGMVVMVNGGEDNRLWGWDGAMWHVVGDEGPNGRTSGGLAYDPQRNKLVFYGGRSITTTNCIADTWEWDTQGWQQLDVSGPDACSHFTLEYDHVLGKVLLFGGGDAETNSFTDMWSWDGREWEQLDSQTPAARFHAMSAADGEHGSIFLIGGFDINNQMVDEMWAWDGAAWEQLDIPRPPALSHARMVFDSNRVQLVLFGGSTRSRIPLDLQDETWILTDGVWQQADVDGPAPSPRGGQMMAYDPVRDRVVLFGGFDAANRELADTWEWNGNSWICVDECDAVSLTPAAAQDTGVYLYQNNPQRNGAYDYPGIRSQAGVHWQTTLGGGTFGSPLFADGRLYICGDNSVYILDSQTGEQTTVLNGIGLPFSALAIAGDLLIGGSQPEKLVAYNLAEQSLAWEVETEGSIYNSPLIIGETVYAVSERAAYALNLQTGQLIWQLEIGNHRGFVGSPAYEDGVLFVGVGEKFLAVDVESAEIRWQLERDTWFYSTALANGMVYVGSDDGRFYAVDQQTGAEFWKSEQAGTGWSAPVISGDIVIVGNIDQNLYAFEALTGEERWHFETEDWATTDPVVSGGVVYVGVGNHDNREGPRPLYAIDAASGQELWQFMADSRLMTAAALGTDKVFAVTIGGTVYALGESDSQPAAELEAGQWSAMVYHEALEQIVLVNGGPEFGKAADEPLELWGWDGQGWNLIDNSGPPWRNWAGVAYDSARDVIVVHGGLQSNNRFDETWEWDGQGWTLHDGTAPGGREGAGMVYDSARERVVLFGGAIEGPEIVGDTWEWDGQSWEQVADSGPAARFPAGVGYDPVRQQVLIYGGHDVRTSEDIPFFNDSWVWDGASWQELPLTEPNPGIRVATSFVFDPAREQILMFGGSGLEEFVSDLWAWDGMEWTLIAEETGMPLRSGFNIVVYDPARDIFVLFGGVDRPGGEVVNETWEWDREVWSCIAGC